MSGREGRDRMRRDASAGTALITAVFFVFAIGMMLFGFQFMTRSESVFAGFNRNGTIAAGLAEAGLQEAQWRLAQFGGTPGATCYANSLVGSGTCPSSTPYYSGSSAPYFIRSSPYQSVVVYQGTFSSDP